MLNCLLYTSNPLYKRKMKKLLVTTICLLGAHLLSAGEIWISPQGNDFNDGTRPSPKATLTSALRQAREWRRTDDERGRGGITICMEGGTYAVSYTHLDVYKRQV